VNITTPSFASNYQMAWNQNFSNMTSDSQIGVSGNTSNINDSSWGFGSGTWISGYSNNEDDSDFVSPYGHDDPFGIDGPGAGNNYLTIRAQPEPTQAWNNWSGTEVTGALSSQDINGNGFTQKYGYFEASIWVPNNPNNPNNDTPNTHPAFWLLGHTPGPGGGTAEIDPTESFGNWGTGPNQQPAGNPNYDQVGWHDWSNPGSGNGTAFYEPTMSTGFHTYGVDVEPTGITYYYDRQPIWTAPIYADAEMPLGVILDLGLGGGTYNNANGTAYNWNLTADPTDMEVQYVAVWASPNSPNYVVPEPASASLLLVGSLLLLARRRVNG
jgi:hypothetical protein